MTSAALIDFYQLEPHPEGGYFKRTYTAKTLLDKESLGDVFEGNRVISSAIYYLLTEGSFSAFHRIKSDELWHFYHGVALNIHVLYPNGKYELRKLGSSISNGESFQLTIEAGCWFASVPVNPDGFSFVGCTVSPGFDFADFELAKYESLAQIYPEQAELISRLCI
jgi:predicted cupin superfamily sugar epimerase